MTTRMKAAVFVEPGRIVLDEKPIPEVGPLDALVRPLKGALNTRIASKPEKAIGVITPSLPPASAHASSPERIAAIAWPSAWLPLAQAPAMVYCGPPMW